MGQLNNDNSKAGLFIFLAIFGIGAIALLTRRSKNNSSSYQHSYTQPATSKWQKVYPSHPPVTPSATPYENPVTPPVTPPTTLYQNKEEWELVRGPDRLIEKIVIHRLVTQNG